MAKQGVWPALVDAIDAGMATMRAVGFSPPRADAGKNVVSEMRLVYRPE